MAIKNIKLLLILILCILGLSFLSSLPMNGTEEWYQNLNKSPLTPPGWVFGVVWPILYILMTIAFWLIWNEPDSQEKKIATYFFGAQLGANLLWTTAFFGVQSVIAGYIWIIIVLFLALGTTKRFFLISKNAGFLMVPYIIWLVFAFYLSLHIFLYNI